VPVSEVSEMESVTSAREEYAENKKAERRYL
jgi:TPP-dependent trihydroxycyclohexane-1,2-dione (THcHDO) dehydratase